MSDKEAFLVCCTDSLQSQEKLCWMLHAASEITEGLFYVKLLIRLNGTIAGIIKAQGARSV